MASESGGNYSDAARSRFKKPSTLFDDDDTNNDDNDTYNAEEREHKSYMHSYASHDDVYANKHTKENSYTNENNADGRIKRRWVTTSRMNRCHHQHNNINRCRYEDEESYLSSHNEQEETKYTYGQNGSPIQEYRRSQQESHSDGEQSYYSTNNNHYDNYKHINSGAMNDGDDRIDFNQMQMQAPQAIHQEEDNDDCYDADDEHPNQQTTVDNDLPIQEVVFMPDQQQQTDDDDDCLNYNEDFSIDSDSNDSYQKKQQHPNSKWAQSIFQGTSESLDVIQRIETVMESLLKFLDKKEAPIIRGYVQTTSPYDDDDDDDDSEDEDGNACAEDMLYQMAKDNNDGGGDPKFQRNFGNIAQSRSFTSICLVMSFIHQLLLYNRTTTTREVYYVFVTHFRNQRECDGVILDVAKILGVSRRSLGLSASPKGWFCGCLEITRKGTLPSGKDVSGTIDGTALSSIQGLPITREWTERDESGCTEDGVEITITAKDDAKVILVIEKEGVYNRLSEDRIFDRFPCILVTGKGFPDLATRALVSTLHKELELPVIGLCDCNPFGISVLALYHYAGDRMGVDGRMRYSVPIQWAGLRPSDVARLKDDLPETVFQKLTDLDNKRIASLLDPNHAFLSEEDEDEVRDLEDSGYKVELEALYWLGPDYMGNWVVDLLKDEYDDSVLEE